MIQATVSLVGNTAACWASNAKNKMPPVNPISPLPFEDSILFLSVPPVLDEGGKGGGLGQEGAPGFESGQFVRRALQIGDTPNPRLTCTKSA